MEAITKIKNDFPGITKLYDGEPVIYLDNAATSLKPRCVVDAMNEYNLGISSNIHRGKHVLLERTSNQFEGVRSKVAGLIGCLANEVVFTKNTTESINMIAHGLNLSQQDIVLVSSDSHHSNILPWITRAQTRFIELTEDGQVNFQQYRALLQLKPKVVALTHCSNASGVYSPLAVMASMAKQAGAIVVADLAQSIPHRVVNVDKYHIDFAAFSAHKMLGPTGVGILYGRQDLLRNLQPLMLGGGAVDWVDYESHQIRKIPHKFESGTPNIAGVLGFGAAIDYLMTLGLDKIAAHDKQLGDYLLYKANERDYMDVIFPNPGLERGALLSLSLRGLDNLDDVARYLSDSYGIMCRNGHLCAQPFVMSQTPSQVVRLSAYIYNDEADIDAVFSALDDIYPILVSA